MGEAAASLPDQAIRRLRLRVRGSVQGVGFRPFAWRLARDLALSGFVLNDNAGVLIEIEGPAADHYVAAIRNQAPPLARIDSIEVIEVPAQGDGAFQILESRLGRATTRIGADAATCEPCRADLFDPASRFFDYPFVNCTHCGPRYTITRALPYDRAQTSMAPFALCSACQADYQDPDNRRFHAEPVACPACGPTLSHPIEAVASALSRGEIVALKGIGGFHLLCDAANTEAIDRLRLRKGRDEKPFAVMVADLAGARHYGKPSPTEEALLSSAARPITLVDKGRDLAPSIAPGLRRVGLVLGYAPVHHLLFDRLAQLAPGKPLALVATSANPGGEPLCADNDDAERRLAGIADLIVSHDRAIAVRADDSVMQVIDGAPAFLRRARGFVPEPIDLGCDGPSVIATGADLKNTVCITRGREAFLSQHVGGLDNAETIRFQRETIAHLSAILDVRPEYAACDLHPDFRSVRTAEQLGLPLVRIPHHLAHVEAVAAEHGLEGAYAGLALDGQGYGGDGGIWGGERLAVDDYFWQRTGWLSPLALPGGDRAATEAWRMGVSALFALGRLDLATALWPDHRGVRQLISMLQRGMKPPVASSLGRLFDAAAALSGLRLVQAYEGQAAMELEALADRPQALAGGFSLSGAILDFRPLLAFLAEIRPAPREAANIFHGTLIAGLSDWAAASGQTRIVLSGGCMMNRLLAEGLAHALRERGLEPFLPQAAPANDGGIALGQAAFARKIIAQDPAQLEETHSCA